MTNEEFIRVISLDGEEWRDIDCLAGLYMVSSEGRVISLSRTKLVKKGVYGITKPRLMKQTKRYSNGIPYYNVGLTDRSGKQYRKTIHRLVCTAFHENPNNYPEVDHINRNSIDNRDCNLRWCTRKMNMANENTRRILEICHKGSDKSYRWRPVVRLKEGKEIQRYQSIIEASKDGFNGNNITEVCRGGRKTHRGYQWAYLDEYEKSNPPSSISRV